MPARSPRSRLPAGLRPVSVGCRGSVASMWPKRDSPILFSEVEIRFDDHMFVVDLLRRVGDEPIEPQLRLFLETAHVKAIVDVIRRRYEEHRARQGATRFARPDPRHETPQYEPPQRSMTPTWSHIVQVGNSATGPNQWLFTFESRMHRKWFGPRILDRARAVIVTERVPWLIGRLDDALRGHAAALVR